MKVVVQRDDLVRELAVVAQATARKATIPILSYVRIDVAGSVMSMSATDFEVWLVSECDVKDGVDGSVTVNAEKLLELAKSLPSGGDIYLNKKENGGVTMGSGSFQAQLQALPVHEFPLRPTLATGGKLIGRNLLRDLISRTRHSIRDDKIHFMNGVLMLVSEQAVSCVSTDSYRLSIASHGEHPTTEGSVESALIPKRTIEALIPMLEVGTEDDISYRRTDNHLFFAVNRRMLISRVIEGTFPAWKRIVAAADGSAVGKVDDIGRESLLQAVKRAALVTDNTVASVNVTLKNAALNVNAKSATFGEVDEDLPVAYTGDDISKSMNSRYLIDCLSAAAADKLEMTLPMSDSRSPVSVTEHAETFKFVTFVMPIIDR